MNLCMTKLRAAATMMLAASVILATAAENKPPNVVIFLTDDLSRNDCTIYNPASDIRTPNMERVAGEGMTFTHAFACK